MTTFQTKKDRYEDADRMFSYEITHLYRKFEQPE